MGAQRRKILLKTGAGFALFACQLTKGVEFSRLLRRFGDGILGLLFLSCALIVMLTRKSGGPMVR